MCSLVWRGLCPPMYEVTLRGLIYPVMVLTQHGPTKQMLLPLPDLNSHRPGRRSGPAREGLLPHTHWPHCGSCLWSGHLCQVGLGAELARSGCAEALKHAKQECTIQNWFPRNYPV